MNFLDEPNLRSVADALWSSEPIGKASVMIGAGFSRNAVPAGAGIAKDKSFPGWGELTEAMARELYTSPDDKDRLDQAIQSASSTSGSLRIADEYQAWKGRGRLDALLQKAIPDEDFAPGPLHTLLFRLPWSDILTTNFDTLLERAAQNEIDRPYSVIRSQLDIPGSMKPRIVKLHGSFPDTKPFIITEDDFRTYERSNPAMVNLVQQCFVENTTCLIGFSGDDPNFLRWTGWVRDVLGPSHMEPIYLVGLFDHSPARRALLERRYVRSIDLAPLFPKSKWSDASKRHRAATEWFLRALAHLRPPDFSKWPDNPKTEPIKQLVANLPELPKSDNENLKTEFWGPTHVKPPEDDNIDDAIQNYDELTPEEQAAISQKQMSAITARRRAPKLHRAIDFIADVWEHNRTRFPNWLVLPWNNRNELERNTVDWIGPIASNASSVEYERAIRWLFELQWRLNKCLLPWPQNLVDAVRNVLDLNGDSTSEYLTVLRLELLRAYREQGNQKEFDKIAEITRNFLDQSSENYAFYIHQLVLVRLETWQIEDAEELLSSWKVNTLDPIWRARKAVLLGELNHKDAPEEAYRALIDIQGIRGYQNLPARSREAEIIWAASILTPWLSDQRRNLDLRREDLRKMGFGSHELQANLSSSISGKPRNPSDGLSKDKWYKPSKVESAFLIRRYAEETASLLHRPGIDGLGSTVSDAVNWMAQENPIAALRLNIRNRDRNIKTKLLDLTHLAKISSVDLEPIVGGILSAIPTLGKRLQRFAGEPQYQGAKDDPESYNPAEAGNWLLKSALTHLRDISPVLDAEQRKLGIQIVFELRKNWKNGQWQTWDEIEKTIELLLLRSSNETIAEMLPSLIEQPIVGFDTDGSSPATTHDVISQSCISYPNNPNVVTNISLQRLDELFRGLKNHTSLSTRSRLANRLALVWNLGGLNKKNTKKLVGLIQALYEQTSETQNLVGVDYLIDLHDFLYFPQIYKESNKSRISSKLFDADWPSQVTRKPNGEIETVTLGANNNHPIVQAANLTRENWIEDGWQLSWSDWNSNQILVLLDRADTWLIEEGRELLERKNDGFDPFDGYNIIAKKIVDFCRKIALPHSMNNRGIANKASLLLRKLGENDVEVLSAIAIYLNADTELSRDEVVVELRRAASSLKPSRSFAFLIGLLSWLSASLKAGLDGPPKDLIDEVALAVRSRRAPELWWALQISEIILRQYPEYTSQQFRSDLIVGLDYLLVETDVKDPTLNIQEQQGSLEQIRDACVNLVAALKKFPEANVAVGAWRMKSKNETIDHVRASFNNLEDVDVDR
ncbi:MAG: SIR2 family protein [Pseudomonadota bacterium]